MSLENLTALAEFTERRDVGPAGALVRRMSDVQSRIVRWAWTGRMASGYLTVWTGEEGIGKSTFCAWLVAQATHGGLAGDWQGRPVDVLIIAGEDGIEDTWKPRLEGAGADHERVATLNLDALPFDWNVRDGIDALRQAVVETNAKLLVFDALLDNLPPAVGGESINSATFVRSALRPLKDLVRELEIVAVISLHPPKARGVGFRDLVQASQAFVALTRFGLFFGWHPDDAEDDPGRRRVMVRGKGNRGRNPGAIEFRIEGRDHLHGDGERQELEVVVDVLPSDLTLSQLLARPQTPGEEEAQGKAERAAEIVLHQLADCEWHPAAPIRDALQKLGLNSGSVVTNAKQLARVESRQRPGVPRGGWEWRIATPGSDSPEGQIPNHPYSLTTESDPLNSPKPQWLRSDSQIPRLVTGERENGTESENGATSRRRLFSCCCADGGVARGDGSCSRCEGQVEPPA